MKKRTQLLITVLVCFIATFSSAQISLSNYATYNLEVMPFRSSHGNILSKKDINLVFNNLTEVKENGDLYIRVNFINGLKSNFLLQTAIPGIGFTYRLSYNMPTYRLTIIDNNGLLISQKIYGGEIKEALFGEFDRIPSVEDLKFDWKANRAEFYAKLESQPEEISSQEMDEELKIAVQRKAQEIATGVVLTDETIVDNNNPQKGNNSQDPEEERRITNSGKGPRKNIYKQGREERNRAEEVVVDDPSEPKLSTTAEQIFDLNGLIEVDACSKYSYQLKNKHPFATLTVFMQKKPEENTEEIILLPNETKFFRGLPHKHAWIMTTYLKEDFQGDQIELKEQLNLLSGDENKPRAITNLLDQYFTQIKPQIIFAPKFSNKTEDVISYLPENNEWKSSLKNFLSSQKDTKISKANQSKIINQTEQLLSAKALKSVSKRIEKDLEAEDQQKLIYSLIKNSKNFRNITPFLAVEYAQSLSVLGDGINNFWNQQSTNRASIGFRLPFEWQLSKRKSGSYTTIHLKATFESLTLDFNRAFQGYAIDPENVFEEPEAVLPDEQFAIQATQLGAGIAWKFYFPLPIFELEAGAFFSHKTRLLWGQDKGQFPRSVFNPENEIISDLVDLSSFRPYFGAKVAIPYYFSGYKFDCDSRLRNVQLFAAIRMYPVNFTMNNNYKVFIKDAANIDFIPIPLQDGKSKFLMHLMVGGAIEF